MEDIKIRLTVIWVCLMLTYLLGDVIRIFAGDFKAGEIGGKPMSQAVYLGLAAFMLIPIIMAFLSITLNYPLNKWLNIVLAVILFLFNAIGLPSYEGHYDKFLIAVGLIFNGLTVWYAWRW